MAFLRRSVLQAATASRQVAQPSLTFRAAAFHTSQTPGGLRANPPREKEDLMDKDALNPRAAEYSKSADDDQAASMQDAAFDPSKTSPEEERATAGREKDDKGGDASNPLDMSPAAPEKSQPKDEQDGNAPTGKQM